jgi:hypothetical protein
MKTNRSAICINPQKPFFHDLPNPLHHPFQAHIHLCPRPRPVTPYEARLFLPSSSQPKWPSKNGLDLKLKLLLLFCKAY